mmetsp:Transcript_16103/g.43887  ORF Transcript_16103/g.43887 Transcript_16103/m.43887 type:complete len:108 (-) Transcript_16103:2840-3163(-)
MEGACSKTPSKNKTSAFEDIWCGKANREDTATNACCVYVQGPRAQASMGKGYVPQVQTSTDLQQTRLPIEPPTLTSTWPALTHHPQLHKVPYHARQCGLSSHIERLI